MSSLFVPQDGSNSSAGPAPSPQSGEKVKKPGFSWPDDHKYILFYLIQEKQKQEYVKMEAGGTPLKRLAFFAFIVNQLQSCGIYKGDGSIRDEPSCRAKWEPSSVIDYTRVGWVPTTYPLPPGIPFHIANATGADLDHLMDVSAGIAISAGQQVFTKEMQKLRIENIRYGLEDMQGDVDLVLKAFSVEIASLPLYNPAAKTSVKKQPKEKRAKTTGGAQARTDAEAVAMISTYLIVPVQTQPYQSPYVENLEDPFDIDQTNPKNEEVQFHMAQIDKFEGLIMSLMERPGNDYEIEELERWIDMEQDILATLN